MSTLAEWILDIPAVRDEAKALWPETPYWEEKDGVKVLHLDTGYMYHLKQLISSPNPEQYYREHKPKQVEFYKEITKGATTIDLSSEPKEST